MNDMVKTIKVTHKLTWPKGKKGIIYILSTLHCLLSPKWVSRKGH